MKIKASIQSMSGCWYWLRHRGSGKYGRPNGPFSSRVAARRAARKALLRENREIIARWDS